jgi:hypothetical protein
MANNKKEKQLWQMVNPVGRPKLYTPETMWSKATEYFKWIDENPYQREELKVVAAGAGAGSEVERHNCNVKRPYTWEGLCSFMNVQRAYFSQLRIGQKKSSEDFASVIEMITKVITEQQFAGAASGFFNGNIVSRYLGLIEKTQNENTNYNSAPLSKEEIKEISKELENDV